MDRLAVVDRPSAALREVGRYLGIGLGSVVNVLNPEVVVLGGIFRALFPVVREQALQALTEAALEAPREQVHVVVPMLGGDAVLIGAAEKAFEVLLADPARALAEACRDAVTATAAPEHHTGAGHPRSRQGERPGVDVAEHGGGRPGGRRVQAEVAQHDLRRR